MNQKTLKSLFDYHKNGFLIKKSGYSVGRSIAVTPNKNGYALIYVNGKTYRYHRIIFMWHHGNMPKYIDHINRIRWDNRIENLREATPSLNRLNQDRKPGRSGYVGVTFKPAPWKLVNPWQAKIKNRSIGFFPTAKEASLAYLEARQHE